MASTDMPTSSAGRGSIGGLVLRVKNTFLDFEDEEVSSLVPRRTRRLKTLPCFNTWDSVEDPALDGETSTSEDDMGHASSCSSSASDPLVGRVWALSQDAQGCREVQAALEDESSGDARREALAQELRGHVLEAAVCPHANHVLQKAIAELRPEAFQFIIEDVPLESVSSMAQNKFGCRVLQRLFERCPSCYVRGLVDAVLGDLMAIAQSPYGNYVVQKMLECGIETDQRQRLLRSLESAVGDLALQPFGCIVVSAVLSKCDEESRAAMARAVLRVPGLLSGMAQTRHGHRTVLALLSVVHGDDFLAARRLLCADKDLMANRFGRTVMLHVEQMPGGAL